MKLVLRGLLLSNMGMYHQTCLLDISLEKIIALCMSLKMTLENSCFCSCSRLPVVHFSPAVALMLHCASQSGLESLVFLIGLTRLSEYRRGKLCLKTGYPSPSFIIDFFLKSKQKPEEVTGLYSYICFD